MKSIYFLKIKWLLKEHGVVFAIKNIYSSIMLKLFHNKEIIFYLDCSSLNDEFKLPPNFKVDSYTRDNFIPQDIFNQLMKYKGGHELTDFFIKSIFDNNGTLWIIAKSGEVSGHLVSYTNNFKEFKLFPMGINDVSLHSGEVFPSYRGQNVYPFLLGYTLRELKTKGIKRVFTSANISNTMVCGGFPKIGLIKIGVGRPLNICGKRLTIWSF